MASERDAAKRAIKKTEPDEPELDDALAQGKEQQHQIVIENNRHKEAMRSKDLGHLGVWFGGEQNAPIHIAAIVAVAGLIGAFLCGWQAAANTSASDMWSKMIERCVALTASCLAFIFGRTGKK